jgi:thioredoxin 1
MADILYFTAAWCGPCKMFKPIVQEVVAETGKQIQYLDIEQNEIATSKYSVTSVPTMIVVENGSVLRRHSGVMSKQQLKSFIQ